MPRDIEGTTNMKRLFRGAITGMGGFATEHHKTLRVLETYGLAHLVTTCDPQLEQFTAKRKEWELEKRGVQVHSDFDAMLDAHENELDFVTLPTPVPLHAPMHKACVERGLACYLEKPPTLFWGELEAMIEAETQARYASQVGFNYIVETPRQDLKRRLLAGEFGTLKRVGFLGHWPRATSYYRRSAWAGNLMQGERLVLDSCTGNAMAHFIHNLLFWCGQDELLSWGQIQEVESELYRAHDIESFDTCFARGRYQSDVEILVTATHAGGGASYHREWVECEEAVITYRTGCDYTVRWRDGRVEQGVVETGTLLAENLRYYLRYLNGEEARPLTRLEDTRPFVHFNNLLFVAAGHIASIAEMHLERSTTADGRQWTAIQGIETVMENFAGVGSMPSEIGVEWGRQGARATLSDLPLLEPVVRTIKVHYKQEVENEALYPSDLMQLHTLAPFKIRIGSFK